MALRESDHQSLSDYRAGPTKNYAVENAAVLRSGDFLYRNAADPVPGGATTW